MQCSPGAGDRINSFALVSYIPDPLGEFLDELRRELVAGCVARSHVTVLPPRNLVVPAGSVTTGLQSQLQTFAPFLLELTEISVFPTTSVIYLSVGSGRIELKKIHDALNRDGLAYAEPHVYHPHVTLAQDIDPQQVNRLLEVARRRWADFRKSRRYEVDVLTFVQNTAGNRWLDLENFPLAEPAEVLK